MSNGPDVQRTGKSAKWKSAKCRGKMRSSFFGKVESSALMRDGGTQRGAVDVGKGSGSAEIVVCSEPATYHAGASCPRIGRGQPVGRILLQRMKQEGDGAVVHRLRGRPSNRKLPTTLKRRVVALFAERTTRDGPPGPPGGPPGTDAAPIYAAIYRSAYLLRYGPRLPIATTIMQTFGRREPHFRTGRLQ